MEDSRLFFTTPNTSEIEPALMRVNCHLISRSDTHLCGMLIEFHLLELGIFALEKQVSDSVALDNCHKAIAINTSRPGYDLNVADVGIHGARAQFVGLIPFLPNGPLLHSD